MPQDSLPLSTVRELKAPATGGAGTFAAMLVVKKLAVKTASNGNVFLSADLGDRTGASLRSQWSATHEGSPNWKPRFR